MSIRKRHGTFVADGSEKKCLLSAIHIDGCCSAQTETASGPLCVQSICELILNHGLMKKWSECTVPPLKVSEKLSMEADDIGFSRKKPVVTSSHSTTRPLAAFSIRRKALLVNLRRRRECRAIVSA
jgi:hypothetical protein